jgi:hypothetical protein
MTTTQPAVPGAARAQVPRPPCEPHAVPVKSDVPIVAAAIHKQTNIATSTLSHSRSSSLRASHACTSG